MGVCIDAACTHLYAWYHSLHMCLGVCMHMSELRKKCMKLYAAKAR